MLTELTTHLPVGLATLQRFFTVPDAGTLMHTFVRWFHFLAGVTWIGLLYFFNLINVPLQKGLDADTKKKVNPELLSRTLWWFRWGAVVTVLAGLMYYAMYIVPAEAAPNGGANLSGSERMGLLGLWLLIVLVAYAILFFLYRVPALTKDGRVLAVVIAILVAAMSVVILYTLGTKSHNCDAFGSCTYLGNKSLSIGVGGAMGLIMLLNVWGVIWPAQKRIIAGLTGGPAAAPDLARKAFLASRTNAWLSLPMLFLMAQSHDIAFFTNK
jgi:uncharacterized membrane protein